MAIPRAIGDRTRLTDRLALFCLCIANLFGHGQPPRWARSPPGPERRENRERKERDLMRVLVLGAGAMGLTVAAKLSGVCQVRALCRPRHAEAIARHGFRMSGLWGEGVHFFEALPFVPEDWAPDYVLVTCKGPDTRALAEAFAPVLRRSDVVSLQNGLGNEEILAGVSSRVMGGTIITGFEGRGPGEVHVSVEAGPIQLGRFPAGIDPAVETLVALFRDAGLSVAATSTVRSALWAKTLYNCALNPLGAIMGVPYGALAAPPAWAIIETIIAEAHAVMTAEGVAVPWVTAGDYLEHLARVQLPATAAHHSSMLQDIEAGRGTEIDFINGAVVARGERHGVPTPVNDTLCRLIRFREG